MCSVCVCFIWRARNRVSSILLFFCPPNCTEQEKIRLLRTKWKIELARRWKHKSIKICVKIFILFFPVGKNWLLSLAIYLFICRGPFSLCVCALFVPPHRIIQSENFLLYTHIIHSIIFFAKGGLTFHKSCE